MKSPLIKSVLKLFFSIIFCLICCNGFSQIPRYNFEAGEYSTEINDNSGIVLDMSGDNENYILILGTSGTEINSIILSTGKLRFSNDSIILTDGINNLEIIYKRGRGFDYKAVKAFQFMLNSTIKLKGFGRSCLICDMLYRNKINTPADTTVISADSLKGNSYQYDTNTILCFNRDNKYKYTFNDLIISEGTWKNENNKLILLDSKLNHCFVAYIINPKLITNFSMPGEPGHLLRICPKKK